jgi:AraC-like DNA-binding protein
VGLGRSVFSSRFTKLVGQSMHRYVIERRMAEAAFLLETSDEPIARIASRVGYETAAAFSKLFHPASRPLAWSVPSGSAL